MSAPILGRHARLAVRLAAIAVLGGALACGDAAGPTRAEIVGTYVLTSGEQQRPDGEPDPSVPVAGELVLEADGSVRRTTQYPAAGVQAPHVVSESGHYVVTSATTVRLVFELPGHGRTVTYSPLARYEPGVLTLTWGHPLDGPDIVERYERRSP